MSLLKATGIFVPHPERDHTTPIVGPLDLALGEGEVLSLLGPSGSGKTTVLRCLAGLEARATGAVLFQGRPVGPAETPAFRRRVVYLPQQPPRFPMTVIDSFRQTFAFQSGNKDRFRQDEALELSRRLMLPGDILTRWIPDLSVGEAQRVALVRALMLAPTVLLLDEFTSSMDEESVREAEAMVHTWLGGGARGGVLVSHDAAHRARLATRELHLVTGLESLSGSAAAMARTLP